MLKSYVPLKILEEFKMFEEANIVNKINEAVKNAIEFAIENKKKFDKTFLLTVVRYQREENNSLINTLNTFACVYGDAISYAASECELWFEEKYALTEENDFNDIKSLCEEYTKTKDSRFSMKDVNELFEGMKISLPKTVDVLTAVANNNSFSSLFDENYLKLVIDFINGLDK